MLMCRVLDLIVAPDSRERPLPPMSLAFPLNSYFDRPIYTPILVVVDVEMARRSHSLVVILGGCSASFVLSGLGLVDHAHHLLLQVLSLHRQAVLVPDEVGRAELKVVALHAPLEQREDVTVVGVGREGEAAAVIHELFVLGRLVQAELIYGYFFLLALDVIIFLVLGATW